MARVIGKILIGFAVMAALLVIVVVIITLRSPRPMPAPLPTPNGYDDFVKAGTLVCDETADHDTMNEEKLRATVSKNAEALRVAREGLGHESRVPLMRWTTNSDSHLEGLARLKRLARAFAAEGRLAELQKRPQDAAESYLETIRVGHECSRGGTIIDSLVGIAIQAIGLTPLEKLIASLDAKQCGEMAAALEDFESRREPVEEILHHEKTWARARFGWKTPFLQLISFKQTQAARQKYLGKMANVQTRTEKLEIDLASRAYELEHGERPKRVEDLAPAYLKTIPMDALTGQGMQLSR